MSISFTGITNIEERASDRILKLKVLEGADKRYSGMFVNNKLHAIQEVGLWYLRFEDGAVPEVLKQRFTNFNQLLRYATEYFKKRHIEIEEIIY